MKKLLLMALLPLVGCVTPGGGHQQAKKPTADDDPSQPCFESIAYDKRFVSLRDKIAINLRPNQLPLEMLSNAAFPTEDEKQTLGVWVVARQACMDAGEAFRARYAPPEYRANMASNVNRVKLLAAKLYAKQITYGEFNQMRAENSLDSQRTMATLQQREREAMAARAAEDQARRDAAVGAAIQNMQTQQLIQQQQQLQNQQLLQQNMPRTTNCQRWGNQVNCTTR